MSGPIPPEISLLKNLTELYETFHMLHYGFITFFLSCIGVWYLKRTVIDQR